MQLFAKHSSIARGAALGYVSTKISIMLKRLLMDLERDGRVLQQDIVKHCRYLVHENVDYDGYDGGRDGQGVTLFLPEEVLCRIPLVQQDAAQHEFVQLLGHLIPSAAREYIYELRFDLADEGDVDFQKAIPFGNQPIVNPASLPFWKPGQIRLFISHRDAHKGGAHKLALALDTYGVSSFVAHDNILPMREWRHEILAGLQTMEVFLLFLTDDFVESLWCQQEVGYALGKGIPIVSLKLGKTDPPGFISNVQALKGSIGSPEALAPEVYKLIGKVLGIEERLQDGIVAAFVAAADFDQVRTRFDLMKASVPSLTPAQVDMIVQGFTDNETLHRAIYLDNQYDRLVKFMKRAEGGNWKISGDKLEKDDADGWDSPTPF